ncbi:P-loop NTPase [Candidatus Poribacteria bacterium]|nr:P-loop NTPase [Candidatus Poribacteria bacterium]
MIISIASGKGGTGKTTLATNLALSIGKCQLLDCDVEEPNSHIFIKPRLIRSRSVSLPVPKVDDKKCTYCGKCSEVCQFSALAVIRKNVLVFQELCHGCGACSILCPVDAIWEVEREIGVMEIGQAGDVHFIHGLMRISEAMSPPLIKAVKNEAEKDMVTIIDAPPGTSCPVIEAVKDSDFCVLVTEPTPFGLNDLVLAVEMLRILEIPFAVVLNRSDVGDDKVDEYCEKEDIPILMKIPMDRELAEAYSEGIPFVEAKPEWKEKFADLYNNIIRMV